MSRGYVVFIGFIILILTYIFMYRKHSDGFISYTVEDTQAKASCAPKTLVRDPVKPEMAQLGVGDIPPSKATGEIPSSSYTPSRAANLPYRNPGTEPARYIQLLSGLQQLQAFFGFEAPAIENECGAEVVLPLQHARSDMGQLLTQVDVLERNPGIPSTITTKELTSIMSNLRYLQKQARKFNANTGVELLGAGTAQIEGFVGVIDDEAAESEDVGKTPATLAQLQTFKTAVDASITTLRTSTANSTDTITVQRLATLDRLRRDVEDIILSLDRGDIKEDEVPIYYDDISGITAKLGDTSQTIGTIFRNVALPPALAKLFPSDMNWKDKITVADMGKTMETYMKDLADGMSWSAKGDIGLELKYDSPRSVLVQKLMPGGTDLYSTNDNLSSANNTYSAISGMKTSVDDSTNTIGDLAREGGLNENGTRKIQGEYNAGGFDWKSRAGHICAGIKKLGMEPSAFGCVEPKEVSDSYSWRGNAALVCKRLENTTDPGLPIALGCPPKEWKGWSN